MLRFQNKDMMIHLSPVCFEIGSDNSKAEPRDLIRTPYLRREAEDLGCSLLAIVPSCHVVELLDLLICLEQNEEVSCSTVPVSECN